ARAVELVRDGGDRRERGRDENVDLIERRRPLSDVGRERARRSAAVVHLPIARDERAPFRVHGAFSSVVRRASMPGSFFPSSSSSDAPPPVEMCLNPPATSGPACTTAAALSPPPTTVKPGAFAMARATS